MIFWILFMIPIVYLILWGASIFLAYADGDIENVGTTLIAGLIIGAVVIIPCVGIISDSWTAHASDLARVTTQQHRIEVQEERVESLSDRLDGFGYPDKAMISLDGDYPWAAMVESLTEAEGELAQAKNERAVAIRSIESRRRGPMGGIVTLMGDGKLQ